MIPTIRDILLAILISIGIIAFFLLCRYVQGV